MNSLQERRNLICERRKELVQKFGERPIIIEALGEHAMERPIPKLKIRMDKQVIGRFLKDNYE